LGDKPYYTSLPYSIEKKHRRQGRRGAGHPGKTAENRKKAGKSTGKKREKRSGKHRAFPGIPAFFHGFQPRNYQ
jgi:hypothetical protein